MRIENVTLLFVSLALTLYCSCSAPNPGTQAGTAPVAEAAAFSLDNRPLYPLEESEQTKTKKDSLLKLAYAEYEEDSLDLDNIIWYGRRLAYQYRYQEAIAIYSQGLVHHPQSPELYRHRGHRYISIRDFDNAVNDFQKAAALVTGRPVSIEPDGIPNRLNRPLSTLQFNIYYHWALAHYLRGEFQRASVVYDTCMTYSDNPDLLVATTDWYYMTLKRRGMDQEAAELLEAITDQMEIIENESYFRRLLMYKGEIRPEELLDLSNDAESAQLDIVTQGYGVGNYYLYNGDLEQALEVFKKILACDYWPAFGYIAAEADYYRLRGG